MAIMKKKALLYLLCILFLITVVESATFDISPKEPMKGEKIHVTVSRSRYSRYVRICDRMNHCTYAKIDCPGYWCYGESSFDFDIPIDFKSGRASITTFKISKGRYKYYTSYFDIKELDHEVKLTCSRTRYKYLDPHYGGCNPQLCTDKGMDYMWCSRYSYHWWYRWRGLAGKSREACKQTLRETTECTKEPSCKQGYVPEKVEKCTQIGDTDIGLRKHTKGTVSGFDANKEYIEHTDFCVDNDYLREGFIDEDCVVNLLDVKCPVGCDMGNGRCIGNEPSWPEAVGNKEAECDTKNKLNKVTGNIIAETPKSKSNKGSFDVFLHEGWNLFSIPFEEGLDPEVLKDKCPSFLFAYGMDSATKSYLVPSFLESGKGYWIFTNSDCKFGLKGTDLADLSLPLYQGWNMVGAPINEVSINKIAGSCEINDIVWGWKHSSQGNYYDSVNSLSPSNGYWIHVADDCYLGKVKNRKDMSKYSEKEVFLISDKNWRNVLPLVPLTTWTGDENCQKGYGTPDDVCVYPTLIYHEEGEKPTLDLSGVYFDMMVNLDGWSKLLQDTEGISYSYWFEPAQLALGESTTYKVRIWNGKKNQIFVDSLYFSGGKIPLDGYLSGPWYVNVKSYINPMEEMIIDVGPIEYKKLIEESFDADSIVYFMQQYSPSRVTIIGDSPAELDDLLITTPQLGAGLTPAQIQRVSPSDYFMYWNNYEEIVYVEGDYGLTLLASTYASLINAPLVIQGSGLDTANTFLGKTIICVGAVSPAGSNCYEQYDSAELQQKYVDETSTDKIILVNPNDWDEKVTSTLFPDISSKPVTELYGKNSLSSAILASAKNELILSTDEHNYNLVDYFIENNINSLGLNPAYLSIFANPSTIQNTRNKGYGGRNLIDVDSYDYGNIDADFFLELAVGRVYGISTSDISSYIARDLFYDSLPNSNNFAMLYYNAQFARMKENSKAADEILEGIGFNIQSVYTDDDGRGFDLKTDVEDKSYINYFDHGGPAGWTVSINTHTLRYEKTKLSSPIVIGEACLTCAFTRLSAKKDLFCTNMLRRGALAYIGAVDASGGEIPSKIFLQNLVGNKDIGTALKETKNIYLAREQYMLLGDPSFNPQLPGFTPKKGIDIKQEVEEGYLVIDLDFPERIQNIDMGYIQNGNSYDYHVFDPLIGQNIESSFTRYFIMNGAASKGYIVNLIRIPINIEGKTVEFFPPKGGINFELLRGDIQYNPLRVEEGNFCRNNERTQIYFNECSSAIASFTKPNHPDKTWVDYVSDFEGSNYLFIGESFDLPQEYYEIIPPYSYKIKIPVYPIHPIG